VTPPSEWDLPLALPDQVPAITQPQWELYDKGPRLKFIGTAVNQPIAETDEERVMPIVCIQRFKDPDHDVIMATTADPFNTRSGGYPADWNKREKELISCRSWFEYFGVVDYAVHSMPLDMGYPIVSVFGDWGVSLTCTFLMPCTERAAIRNYVDWVSSKFDTGSPNYMILNLFDYDLPRPMLDQMIDWDRSSYTRFVHSHYLVIYVLLGTLKLLSAEGMMITVPRDKVLILPARYFVTPVAPATTLTLVY
jgi:hypothetical protein